jgi:toxin FitB
VSPATADATALCDTSVALPALLQDHELHALALEAVTGHRAGIAGHALFETYSVLTRHPQLRVSSRQALALLDGMFPHRVVLSPAATNRTLENLAAASVAGGATYDGLVAGAAAEARLPLLTLDRRALRTYEAVGAQVTYLLTGS